MAVAHLTTIPCEPCKPVRRMENHIWHFSSLYDRHCVCKIFKEVFLYFFMSTVPGAIFFPY